MKILGVDSSSSPASASVVCDGKILSEVYVNNGLTHSKTLMSVIDRALVFAGITADDIDSVAVAAGPGSFTGVRIGVSCAKGIAFERDIPCAAISTLEMLAYNLLSVEGTVCAVMDARCSQVYTATFKSHNGSITRITEDRAISIAELDGHLKNIDGKVYLVSPETAVAAALTGEITDPTTLGLDITIDFPEKFRIDDSAVIPPAAPEEAKSLEILRGPNIKKFPDSLPQTDKIKAPLVLKVGDNITTDHIMPAGAKILPFRSNIPYLSQFCFGVCDKSFPERAKAAGQSIIVGGTNYGQGSSREHAALVPLYLGVRVVITKSFARIHIANLINAGIMPLTFKNPDDYDKLSQDDILSIDGVFAGMDSGEMTLCNETTGDKIPLVCTFTQRQKDILKAGGLLSYTKKEGK